MELLKKNDITCANKARSCKTAKGHNKSEKKELHIRSSKEKTFAAVGTLKKKMEATSIFNDIEYIKSPITKIIVVNSKPSRGE